MLLHQNYKDKVNVEEIMDRQKNDMLSQIRIRVDSEIVENHQIF